MRFSNPQSASVVDLLFYRAASQPDSIAFTFLADRTGEERNLSFSELLGAARAIAADLRRELRAGDRALLVYPQGLDFIKAFFGCLLAGVIAAPANPIRRNQATNRLRTIASDAGISAILTVSKLSTILRDNFEAWGGEQPKWFCTDLQNTGGAFDGDTSHITSTAIALLQYTSGSTGTPKGVVVTHGNILHNQAIIAQACGHSESTVFVGWLPLFHDMGLMGNILQPLYLGIRSVLFSTISFLASPAKWLRTISDYKGTTSGGPNFAYDHCAARIADDQLAGVDLSSWNVAFNGAEPVRADTLDRFTQRFEKFGFRRDAFNPCYGMAEATLFITGKRVGDQPLTGAFDREALARQCAVTADGGVRLVSSGKAWGDTRIVVVDPESKRMCGHDEIGEIWVHSPSVAEGYWRNPEATTETFRANLAEFAGVDFLRTGDLGFLAGGELFVTGRCKELMILRGRNYYPQDIEAAAIRSSPDLGPVAAAFADGESEDAVAIVVELDRSHRKTLDDIPARTKLVEAIQTAVFEELDLRLSEIAFVPAGALPRTTSGKLQRFACRRDYLENRLHVLYRERAGGGVESASAAIAPPPSSIVCRLIASVLRCPVSEVRADRSLASLGMDSLGAAELQARLRGELGIECRIEDALAAPTIGDLLSKCSASSDEPGIAGAVATKELPLTETQQSLWFPWKAAPESSAYNVTAALRIRSGIDVAVARTAMQGLIARHPILAARFTEDENGEPRQHPGAVLDGFVVERDAALLDEHELRKQVAGAVERKIDLRNGPVFRLEMFLNASGGPVLVFIGHHIVVDLWSMSVLIRDFAAFYSEARATSEPNWAFAQYIEDCEGLLRGETGARAAAYWAARLAGDRAALELPADKPVPVVRSARGGRLHFEIPKELEHSLRKTAAERDATLYMLLLCAYQTLLHGSTGQNDVTVGTPVSGRSDAGWFDGVGCFINIVPIRSRSAGQLRFVDALAIAKQEVLGAVANQVYSRRAVVSSKTPWFETMFALQRPHLLAGAAPLIFGIEGREFSLGNLTASSFPAAPSDVQFDLSLMMVDGADELSGCFEYRTDLFEGATIERWKRRFVALLEKVARDPEQTLRELAPFAPGEREWVLQQASGERLDVPRQTLHGMIEAQAGRTPDGIALEMGDRRFSYAQLNHAANAIAKELIARGVGPEDRVGVLLERSPESLVAMLGVWKAGGVYVPFDSAQPMSRFDLTSLATVITRAQFRCEELLNRDDPGNPGVSVDPDNAAYMIYTSGSSGTPKGVIVSHRNAVNFGLAQLLLAPVVESDRLLQLAAFTFDASLSDVMMAWFRGACLCIAPEEGRVPGPALERFIRERGITMITVAASVLEAIEASPYPALRQIISTAEACRRETVQRWAAGYALFNGYGPTEATIGATLSRCAWSGQEAGWRPPIGRPFSNYEVYILDTNLEPAPIGTAGEIFVGGEGVARGYVDDPVLTASRYIPNPFSGTPGRRMYRTGDRGRVLPSGELECLGRFDSQIKLHGFRIEPGEVEMAICETANVRECAVVDAELRPGRKGLIAYVVADGDFSEPALLDKLRRRLPHYMVPSAILRTAQLPRSANGKVERRKLPAYSAPEAVSKSDPLNEIERRLVKIWRGVLEIDTVGRHENFFDLGGNSFLLGSLQRRILAEFGVEVPVTEFFVRPTISSLGELIGGAANPQSEAAGARLSEPAPFEIAVIGMAGRFPGANDVDGFWRNLARGRESITFFDEAQLMDAGWEQQAVRDPAFVPARGALDGIEYFDAAFFDFTPREAELLDPQKRVLLECAQAALDDAAYSRDPAREAPLAAGVFVGISNNSYFKNNLSRRPELIASVGELAASIASDKSFTATLLSYKLNLSGPSLTLDTACSTSLAAVHEAAKSLLLGECDVALAGAASLDVPVAGGHVYEEAGIASPDGHCRPFDAQAKGTVKGAGVGVVVLKRLADAMRDGDHIYAVVKGSAVNNDGRQKAGYTAPSVTGQEAVIRRALAVAGFAPESIGYVEAHGTGTPLGDPIELTALERVFTGAAPQSIAVGSVKSNIGHLDVAAGIAGFIKAVLAVHFGEIPPTLHFSAPNPRFDLVRSPFFVNTKLKPFNAGVRRAGVSSFGIGGTNVHVAMESAPDSVFSATPLERPLLAIASAKTSAALSELTGNLARGLRLDPEVSASAVSFTLACGRRHMDCRRSYVYSSIDELARLLEEDGENPRERADDGLQAAFLFPGQGSQFSGMAAEAYRVEPVFRECVDSCLRMLDPTVAAEVRRALVDGGAGGLPVKTDIAQPALFVVEYAIANYLREFGVHPRYLLGHSIGEYVAACLAGVFDFDAALRIVTLRGRLMSKCPPGAMLAVALAASEVSEHLVPGCAISAMNSPGETVVSGTPEAIELQRRNLRRLGVPCVKLETSHAFHSSLVDGIMEEFRDALKTVRLNEPGIPLLSNVTGDWMSAADAVSPDYWVRHLRERVRFADCAERLLTREGLVLIEAGPRHSLVDLVRHSRAYSGQRTIRTLGAAKNLLSAVGALWESGFAIDWNRYTEGLPDRRRVRLPAYPFERHRYWIDRPAGSVIAEPSVSEPAAASRSAPQLSDGSAKIAEIWRDLLGLDLVRPSDRFLDAGGSSLSALRLRERLRTQYGLNIPTAAILGNPSVEELAAMLPASGAPLVAPAPDLASADGRLSVEQEQIWLSHRLAGDPAVMNLPAALRFEGPLDEVVLASAFTALLEAHPILRAQFIEDGRSIRQQIRPAEAFRIRAENAASEDIARISSDDASRAFDLERDPLLRVKLLRTAPEQSVLLVTAHHIVSDGVSLAGLVAELAMHYRSAPPTEPCRTQYEGYIASQSRVSAESLEAQLEYWKRTLADAPVLQLRGQRARPPRIIYDASVETVQFDAAEIRSIEDAAKINRVTPFVFLLAAYRAALARHSDQRDMCIGTAVSTRPDEHATTVGCFVNRLTMRTQGDAGQPFDTWIEAVKQVTSEALDRRDVPFTRIVSAIRPASGHDPLHQAAMAFESATPSELDFGAARAFSYTRPRAAAQHDLTLWVAEDGSGMQCRFEYRTAVFPADLIRAVADDFAAIVRGALHDQTSVAIAGAATPSTPTESALLEIWQEVVSKGPISVTDNFFSIGGNSFAAAWVVVRVEKRFGVRMDLAYVQEHPTIETMAKAIDASREFSAPVLPPLTACPEQRFEEFALTDLQQAYWTGRSPDFEMGNVSTHGYLEMEAEGLDLERFREALQLLIARHDSLRTRITAEGKQVVLSKVPRYDPALLDLRGMSGPVIEAEVDAIREELSQRVFDVLAWPLFEVRITRLSDSICRIHIGIEALIADGWSAWILLQDFNAIYDALSKGAAPSLPELPYQFRDYVLALESLKDGPLYRTARDYWMARLDTLPPAPALQPAVDPSQIDTPRFRRRNAFLPPVYWRTLKQNAADRNITPSVLLLAVYSEILAAWTNSEHFTINITVFNRIPFAPEVNQMVGNFSAISLLEVDLRQTADLAGRAQKIGERLWRDLAHIYFSGVQVLRALGQKRGNIGRARMPVVFTSMIGFLPGDVPSQAGALDPAREVCGVGQTSQVWLDCVVAERDGGLVLIWDAVEDLFPAGLLDDMFQAFETLLVRLATSEKTWSAEALDLAPAAQLARRPPLANEHAGGTGELLHGLFKRSARVHPNRIAVSQGAVELTYSELDRLSRALAHELRERGARPNQLVAVLMEKGWEQVVAVLGILEAGAAYLPVDSSLPSIRQVQLLRQGEARLIVAQPHVDLPEELAAECQCIVVDRERLKKPSPPDLAGIQSDRDLAYVIFTSGSTGVPKGVMIDHRGAVNTVLDINRRFGVTSSDAVLALSSLSFDLSVYDIFGLLAAGGQIVLPTAMGQREPSHWLELIDRRRVTVWNTVPALMQMLVDFAEVAARPLAQLRLALLSGDWIPIKLPDRVRAVAPGVELIGMGGATEASIWSIVFPIAEVRPEWKSIPYGKALDNQSMLVLDSRLRDCPDWTIGEIYIGGVGVALGYWHDAELTAARFLNHPRSRARLYRTGDMGRYLADGNIEFLGRMDTQVKIAGHRIELGEIEANLLEHPQVQEAAVLVDQAGQNKRLIAYVAVKRQAAVEQTAAERLGPWREMIEAGMEQAADPANDIQASPAEVKATLERMTSDYVASVCEAFAALGLFARSGEKFTVDDALRRGVAHRYERWLRRAMKFLAEAGLLHESEGGFECVNPFTTADRVKDGEPELWQLLTEEEHSAQLYIRPETVEGYQKIFPLGHAVMRAAVTRYSAARGGAPLRVLEVGAGHGTCTQHVLPVLPEGSSYLFTDISQLFLRSAREKFRDFGFVEYGMLNLDEDVQAQGFDLHSFDLVIAASVLHDTRDVRRSLTSLRSLLNSSGLLLTIEETKFYPFFDLGMGLQQGFDIFEDVDLRADHPLLSREQWGALLRDCGYDESTVIRHAGSASDIMGFDVIAAIGPAEVASFDSEEIAAFLAERLPRYMLPSRFIAIDRLPLNSNGKVDRQALPAIESAAAPETEYVAPATPLEEELAAIWKDLLGLERVGTHDNFFMIGGDSLLASQFVVSVRERANVQFPMRAVFETPTIVEIAGLIEATRPLSPGGPRRAATVVTGAI